jgi:protein-S-isoprenylcysteine O-methyltransferase Ste14
MTNNQIIAFIIGTALIALFSWFVSIREKRYHGIPRFFVFEGLLILGLFQSPSWFDDPWSMLQILSWALFLVSVYYAVYGIYIYLKIGKPGPNFEETSKLVTTGLYKYIRHPMYAALLFLGTGMFLKDVNLVSAMITVVMAVAVYLTCKVEEKEMIKRFGNEYRNYMKKTRLWIPFLI